MTFKNCNFDLNIDTLTASLFNVYYFVFEKNNFHRQSLFSIRKLYSKMTSSQKWHFFNPLSPLSLFVTIFFLTPSLMSKSNKVFFQKSVKKCLCLNDAPNHQILLLTNSSSLYIQIKSIVSPDQYDVKCSWRIKQETTSIINKWPSVEEM